VLGIGASASGLPNMASLILYSALHRQYNYKTFMQFFW
jgi:hypothetical protein